MIINKLNKTFQTRSDKPNSNWLGKEWRVVPDDSVLANKIMQLFPRFDLVLDENDNVIDVVEVPKTDEELKLERVAEIEQELEELDKIINRATEDLYSLTGAKPYETIQETIARKKELREEKPKINH